MENQPKTKGDTNQNQGKLQTEKNITKTLKENDVYLEAEKELNSKILQITMKIKERSPELSKYLEEMTETIPDKNNPEITLKNLRTYYDSLTGMLNKYALEHPIVK